MRPPFDIAADLDTPVSAYLKLRPFKPRFLLESVEGGERLARYSFIGFGDALEVCLDRVGLTIGARRAARPADRAGLLAGLRSALAQAPVPKPDLPAVPLAGGLVGAASYDIVRFFERLRGAGERRAASDEEVPEAHFVAPRSMLVFDHLTRGVALLHDGPESERQALRREVIRALRGAVPEARNGAAFAVPTPSLSEAGFVERVRAAQEYIAAGDVYQLVLSIRFAGRHTLAPFEVYRALRLINPSPYMYYFDLADFHIVGSSPEILTRLEDGVNYVQLKGSAFFYDGEIYADHCRFDPRWHVDRVEESFHTNYHLGFRCCRSVTPLDARGDAAVSDADVSDATGGAAKGGARD